MSDFHETTAATLKAIREAKDMTQDEVALILGITQTAVSKIEGSTRGLSDSEKKLLDWYFFGIVPARIHASTIDLKRMLEFDEAEWLIIGLISRRRGLSESEWIASHIRDYLAIYEAQSQGKANGTDGP